MNIPSRLSILATLILLAALACSDDDSTTGTTPPDTTPPAVTNVVAVDAKHIDVTFNEDLARQSAEVGGHYVVFETTAPFPARGLTAAPGDTLVVGTASLHTDRRTVTLTTLDSMNAVEYELGVSGVSDAHGNYLVTSVTHKFAGSDAADVTPPQVTYRSPAPNATNVGVGTPVVVRFSEPVDYISFVNGVSWERTTGGNPVSFTIQPADNAEFSLIPQQTLDTGTNYTVTLDGVTDYVPNEMPLTSWSFTTSGAGDNTPPTVVSTVPANGTTNVGVNTNLSITFSEPVNQITFSALLTPDAGDGISVWSDGGSRVTYDPNAPLLDDQQYTLTILPGGMQDLAGNDNIDVVVVVFTTGSRLGEGSFAGTIAGDPGTAASDPTGAIVAAADRLIFDSDDVVIFGSDGVAGNNTYDIGYLADRVYYPIAIKSTNSDGILDPGRGDAVGLYGIDLRNFDLSPDSVTITGGSREIGVDFPLYDPSAIWGNVTYDGAYADGFYPISFGVFDVNGFDPTDPPDYASQGSWPDYREFVFHSLDDGLADGTYYVGAYIDVNTNSLYDPATDPAGFYGGGVPTAVTIQNGSDAVALVIAIEDPVVRSAGPAVAWPAPANRAPWLKKLSRALR